MTSDFRVGRGGPKQPSKSDVIGQGIGRVGQGGRSKMAGKRQTSPTNIPFRYVYIFNIEWIEKIVFKVCPYSALTNLTHLFQGQAKSDQSEVWFHEDCICWMPQIRLIGCQILGLSEAIRVSQRAVCGKCNYRGSTLACSQMRCRETAHFPCAQDMDWTIDEDNFLARCHVHSEETQ